MLSSSVIILRDNAMPHVNKVYVEALARKKRKVREYPAYSPDLLPCVYHIFVALKKSLMGQRFHSEDDVKAAVLNWLHDQPTSFFADGIRNPPRQWDTCLNAMGDFF
ncbi:histone-lysine N-methyltransferase SETMAR [Trichonephila clavipes]|nr:histone-lysine N-methyltransferase SETMAR [Trichonephila clavipes]